MAFEHRSAAVVVFALALCVCARAQTTAASSGVTTTEAATSSTDSSQTVTTAEAATTTRTSAAATVTTTTTTGAAGAAAGLRRGEVVLYLHLAFMTLAWAACIPAGIALVTLLRGVPFTQGNGRLKLHVRFQCVGWLLSLLGFAAAVAYCELYSSHLASTHARVGFGVVAVAELQPLSAAIRPAFDERRCCARATFAVLHKCVGYVATLLGIVNLGLGLGLAYKLGYDQYVLGTASGLTVFGMLPLVTFGLFAGCRRNNAFSRWLLEPNQAEVTLAAERAAKIKVDVEEIARHQQEQTAEAVAKALSLQQQQHHAYKLVTLTRPTWCSQCKRFMWGFASQGYHCVKCNDLVCAKCILSDDACPQSATLA